MYFVISNSDGDTRVRTYTKDELQECLSEDSTFHESLGEISDPDTNYWKGMPLIIKGQIVQPQPVEQVIEWELP